VHDPVALLLTPPFVDDIGQGEIVPMPKPTMNRTGLIRFTAAARLG